MLAVPTLYHLPNCPIHFLGQEQSLSLNFLPIPPCLSCLSPFSSPFSTFFIHAFYHHLPHSVPSISFVFVCCSSSLYHSSSSCNVFLDKLVPLSFRSPMYSFILFHSSFFSLYFFRLLSWPSSLSPTPSSYRIFKISQGPVSSLTCIFSPLAILSYPDE